jgi:hypothetical protein
MQISQAKEYFQLGVVTNVVASPVPMGKGWLLTLEGTEGRRWILETKLGKPKVFASMDTLLGQVEQIAGPVRHVLLRVS